MDRLALPGSLWRLWLGRFVTVSQDLAPWAEEEFRPAKLVLGFDNFYSL